MKTTILSGSRPAIGLTRVMLRTAAITFALAMTAGNLLATTVSWISGGPSESTPSGAGYVDGDLTTDAEYNNPRGLAIDQSGNYLLIADQNNNAVRLVTFNLNATGTLLTLTNNVVAGNLFSTPVGVAIDSADNVFVLNRAQNNNGTVLEFDSFGDLLMTNLSKITNAGGIALDPFDDIYVTASNQVLKVSYTNTTSVVATITASNCSLQGIVVKHNGLLAVCDSGRNGILLINPTTQVVTTNSGFHGQGDFITQNDTASSNIATFFQPSGIAESADGTLIVTDYGNNRVKAVLPNGSVTNIYGVTSSDWISPWPGFEDGTVSLPDELGGVAARSPFGVVISPDGTLYVSEDYYDILRHVTGIAFEPPPPPPPIAVTGLTATLTTNVTTVEVVLNWNASTSGSTTNYLVERATSTGGPYTVIASVGTATTFTDTTAGASPGTTYFYVVVAQNTGGNSANSNEVSVTIPVPPPPPPQIGWYDFEANTLNGVQGFYSTLHPVTPGNPFTANNPILIAVFPATNGVGTFYITEPPFTNGTPAATVASNGSTPPIYLNNQLFGSSSVNPLPTLPLSNGVVTIEAVNRNGLGELSSVASASFIYQMGQPTINAPNANAARFTVSDVTTNVTFFYTLDGSDPSNAPASQQVSTTNGTITLSLNGTTNIFFQVRAVGFGPTAGYQASGAVPFFFSPNTFVPNTLSWGFAAGECSSAFIGAAGQTFLAPVTLTMLPNVGIYSMQFNMTVASSGPGVTNPAPAVGPFSFQSMLMKPIPGTTPTLYTNIPPYMFAGFATNPPPSDLIPYDGENFVNLTVSNGNELAVGWVERAGFTNLYNTLGQTLITFSLAHDDLFPNAAQNEPNGVIVGAYLFKLSPNAVNSQQYQIELNEASATSDGVGAPGSGVQLVTPQVTNANAMGPGTLNAIKIVTVGSIPYLVGNVYPFGWFNAGDFGNSNLQSADIQQVFNSAVYGLNLPIYDATSGNGNGGFTNVSDMYDAMDSCGQLGFIDNNPADKFFGYYTNAGPNSLTIAQQNQMFLGNYSLVNNMAFGDGQLDVADIYLTYLRSQFTNNFLWFQRLWTNGVRVATAQPAPGIIPASFRPISPPAGKSFVPASSITNTPFVNFTATDIVASAGQTLTIPINATVFGPYPMRMLMLSVSVVPLDGSPALTTPVQFSPNAGLLTTAFGTATPMSAGSSGAGNYSASWLPSTFPPTDLPGFTNLACVGTLTVTIPTNATSSSSYAIHFDRASGSPSGLLSFPNRKITGIITLSSRTNSYYGDGIPDWWRLKYFGTIYNQLSCSNANADGTCLNNWQKYHAGLDPTDPTSVLNEGFDQPMSQSQTDMVLYWPSVSGKTYNVQRSTTLFPPQWTTIYTVVGDGTYMEIHDTANYGAGYYQVTTQ